MKRTLFLLLLLGNLALAFAQEATRLTLTLDEAIELGLSNRPDFNRARIQEAIAENNRSQLTTSTRPQIKANVDARYNIQLQKSVIPGNVFNIPGQSSEDQVIAFGTKNNYSGTVSLDQAIFDPRFSTQKLTATLNGQAASQQTELTRLDAAYNISLAYYDVLIQRERTALSEENLSRNQALYQTTKTRVDNGTLYASELNRLQLDVRNAQASLDRDRRAYELSIAFLARQLGQDPTTIIEASDKLQDLAITYEPVAKGPEDLLDYQIEKTNLQLNSAAMREEKRTALPTVSAYALYGAQHLSNDFNVFADNTWSTFSYLGIKVAVPIYDGGLRKSRTNGIALQMDLNRENLQELQSQLSYEIKRTAIQVHDTEVQLQNAEENLALARTILAEDEVRFQQGALLQSDLRNTQYSLRDAENGYLTSLYDYLNALAAYRRALGS